MTFDPDEGARISSALIRAITEAKLMADAGDVGPEIRDLVRHARDLYELLREQFALAGPDATEHVHRIYDAIGNRLELLEALLSDGSAPSALH